MKTTDEYGFNKPESTDYYNVEHQNENWDAVDRKLKELDTFNQRKDNPHNVTKEQVGLGNVENKSSADIRGELTSENVTNALCYTPINSAEKGSANGIAELNENGLIPTSQLPSYVNDVEEYSTYSKLPSTGESGKIYVTTDTNLQYRWSGSEYAEISKSLALGETSESAYRGDRGKIAYEHSQQTSGNPHGVTKSQVGLGNVPNVATNDQTPTWTIASTLANIVSGEKLSVIFGKIAKVIAQVITNTANISTLQSKVTSPILQKSVELSSKTIASGTKGEWSVTPPAVTGYTPMTIVSWNVHMQLSVCRCTLYNFNVKNTSDSSVTSAPTVYILYYRSS